MRVIPPESYPGFEGHPLDDGCAFWTGRLPNHLKISFEELWGLHPEEFHEINMHGRLVKTPRWQQAYGMDYHYTGRVNQALPVPGLLQEILAWSQSVIDARINGILVNWYDGKLGHYIGRHKDSTQNMIPGAPLVTVSLGELRKFRLRREKEKGFGDFMASDRCVFIMPYETNRQWSHEVPRSKRNLGRRVSVTLRAFME